jgi:hypothetical protein
VSAKRRAASSTIEQFLPSLHATLLLHPVSSFFEFRQAADHFSPFSFEGIDLLSQHPWGIVFMAQSLCIVDRAESHLMVRVATGQRQVRAWGDEVSRRTQPMDLECRGAGEAALEPVDQAE